VKQKSKKLNYLEELRQIKERIEEIDMQPLIDEKAELVEKEKARFRKKYPDKPEEWIEYLVLRAIVRSIITYSTTWLGYWATDKKRMGNVFEVFEKYINNPNSLPESYHHLLETQVPERSHFLHHSGNKNLIMLLIPRTVGKSFWGALHHIRKYIQRPTSKWLITHSNEEKAVGNLITIKSIIMSPWLSLICPDLFAEEIKEYFDRGGRVTTRKINLVTTNDLINGKAFRRESTFTASSPKVEMAGQHFDGVWADDLSIGSTSSDEKSVEKVMFYFKNLYGLAEIPGKFEVLITGTEWWEESFYTKMKRKKTAIIFEMPACWEYKGEMQYLSHLHNAEILDQLRDEFEENFEPQIMMNPLSKSGRLKLVENDDFLFAFKDEIAPENVRKLSYNKDYILNNGGIVTSFDPSYSTKNKDFADDKSKATIGTGVIFENSLYMFDDWQDLGGEFQYLYNAFKSQIVNNNSDMAIMDCQGTQMSIGNEYARKLRTDSPDTLFVGHKKGSLPVGKAEKAMYALGEKFRMGQIRIHWELDRFINQIKRFNLGFDYLDVLIQIALNLNWEGVSAQYRDKQKNRVNMDRYFTKTRKPFSKIGAY
jgi:hypothetical protein